MRTCTLALIPLLGAVLSGCGVLRERLEEDREGRISELEALAPRQLAQAKVLDGEVACDLVELHLLRSARGSTRGTLAVDCSDAVLTEEKGGAYKLSGVLSHISVDQVWLADGGLRQHHCLARTDAGWEVLGLSYELGECAFEVIPGASAEVQVAAARDGVAAGRELLAREGVEAARVAMEGASKLGALPTRCKGLEDTPARRLGVVDRRGLGGDASAGKEVDLTSGAFRACLDPTPGAPGCSLTEPWRYALVLHVAEAEAPVMIDAHSFTGGTWKGFANVVDLQTRTLLCHRPLEAQLVVSSYLQGDYERKVAKALCAGVSELGGGKLHVDPFWGCE